MIRHKFEQGFGLIEVLVALLIIAVGLLGTIALQSRAMQAELESYQRVQAMMLVEDMVARISANRRLGVRDCYVHTADYLGVGSTYDGTTACVPVDPVADADLNAWDSLLRGSSVTLDGNNIGAMIGARGCITSNAAGDIFTIAVAWQGLYPTVESDNPCAADEYGEDGWRRVLVRQVEFADLSGN